MARTLLFVEDDEAFRTDMTMLLKLKGFKVMTAPSRAEGIALYDAHRSDIDLVITDCDMEFNHAGFDFISDIRKRGDALPILMLSKGGGDESARRTLLAALPGNNTYISKQRILIDALVDSINMQLSSPSRDKGLL